MPVPRSSRRRTRLLAAAVSTLAAALVAAPSASAGLLTPEHGGSPNADAIHTLYLIVMAIALVVFLVVGGLIVYVMIRFRAKRGVAAAQIHGNTRLEIGWTIGAAVILVFITVATFIALPSIKNPKPSLIDENGQPVAASDHVQIASTDPQRVAGPKMTIRVDGQQYVWRYQYPNKVGVYTDMVVPIGMTVLLDITSDDVNHSWWIPKLGGKFDAIPGYVNHTWFRIPTDVLSSDDATTYAGKPAVVYTGQCSELCGRNHANMYARVIGLRFADYQQWLRESAASIRNERGAGAKQRSALNAQENQ